MSSGVLVQYVSSDVAILSSDSSSHFDLFDSDHAGTVTTRFRENADFTYGSSTYTPQGRSGSNTIDLYGPDGVDFPVGPGSYGPILAAAGAPGERGTNPAPWTRSGGAPGVPWARSRMG